MYLCSTGQIKDKHNILLHNFKYFLFKINATIIQKRSCLHLHFYIKKQQYVVHSCVICFGKSWYPRRKSETFPHLVCQTASDRN